MEAYNLRLEIEKSVGGQEKLKGSAFMHASLALDFPPPEPVGFFGQPF